MLIFIFVIIIIVEVLLCIWQNYRYLKFLYKYKNITGMKKETDLDVNSKIFIIIPCLREQDVILETIKHFLSRISCMKNIHLIIVTTQKENYEKEINKSLIPQLVNDLAENTEFIVLLEKYNKILSGSELKQAIQSSINLNRSEISDIVIEIYNNSKTTYETIQNEINENNEFKGITLINYPDIEGIMAHQLNYVLRILRKYFNGYDENNSYFGIYNADSLPNGDTVPELIQSIVYNNYPVIIQQYSALISNIKYLSNIMKGFAVYQTNFEITNGFLNSLFPSIFLRNHVVGHGMFIRLDFLKSISGFNTSFWCEDIFLSFYLRSRNISVIPLMNIEKSETPIYLKNLIKQNATWFKSAFQAPKMFLEILRTDKKPTVAGVLFMLHQIRGTLSWLFCPFFVLYSFIYPIIEHNVWVLFFSFAIYFFTSVNKYFNTLLIVELLDKTKTKNKLALSYFASLSYIISNLGPIYSIINRKATKHKTVR